MKAERRAAATLRVAIYARISKADVHKDESGRDVVDPNSVPVQLEDCRDRAAEEGWEVAGEYVDEGKSGYDPKVRRAEFERLLADVGARRVDAILSREMERLLRQMKDGRRVIELYEATGFHRLFFTLEGTIDLRRARDRKDFYDRVSSAEFYSAFLGEKAQRTHRRKAQNGEWHGGGRRPFGFNVVPDPTRPLRSSGRPFYRLEQQPREAQLIREAARSVIGGASLHSIVVRWNDGPDPARKDSGARWTLEDVRRVLSSEQVAGLRGGVAAKWEGILSRDERELVVAALSDPARRRGPRAERQVRRWALAGSVYCGRCGCRMDGRAQTRRLASGEAYERRQYVCSSANGGCSRVGIDAPGLERHVLAAALERMDRVPAEPDPEPPSAPSDRDAGILAEMRELEARKDAIARELADGLDARVARSAAKELNDRLEALRSELARGAAPPRRGRRTFLASLDAPDRFLAGEVPEMPSPWPEQAADLLAALGARATIGPASARGVRFEPSRVSISWDGA